MSQIPEDPIVTFDTILPPDDQEVITRAALYAHEGRHAEAEVVRFRAGYHNLREA